MGYGLLTGNNEGVDWVQYACTQLATLDLANFVAASEVTSNEATV